MNTKISRTEKFSLWVYAAAAAVRTAFGLVWAIDAFLKWQPAFFDNYLSYITGIAQGQPQWLLPWFNFWGSLIKLDPNLFARLTQIIETIIAIGLLAGLARKWVYILGVVFASLIWVIPEGFGGPYTPGATDVGAGLIYVFLFLALIVITYVLGRSPYSVDFYLEKRYPSWRKVAELAPAHVLEKEPPYLSWTVQGITIAGLAIMLVIFLIILSSELKSAPPSQGSMLGIVRTISSLVHPF